MKNILVFLLLALLALALPVQAGEGVWTPAGPPGAARIPDYFDQLVVDPFTAGTLYLVYFGEGSSGAWKSVDGGGSWTSINAGLGNSYVFSLVPDPFTPGTLYALASSRVFKSADGGATWTEVYRPDPVTGGVLLEKIVADPRVPGALWGIYQNVVFRSLDGGASWTGVATFDAFINGLVPDPKTSGILYVFATNGLWRSADGGAHWTKLDDRGVEWIEIAPSRPETLYSRPTFPFAEHPGCARSDDSGATWAAIPFPGDVCMALVVDPQNHLKVWALGESGRFYASTDGGATWTLLHEGLPTALAPYQLERDPRTGVFYILGPEGVLRGADGGLTWTLGNGGLTRVVLNTFLPLPGPRTALLASVQLRATQPEAAFLRSRNRGRFWSTLPLTGVTALEVDPRDSSRVLAATGGGSPVLHESGDGGVTWRPLSPLPGVASDIVFHPRDAKRVLLGTQLKGAFQSRDGGRTWQASSAGIPFPGPCDHISCQSDTDPTFDITIDPRNPDRVLAIFDTRLIRSENGGWRWLKLTEGPLRGNFVTALARDSGRRPAIYAGTTNGLFKSLDGGVTWFLLRQGPLVVRDLAFDPRNGGALYAATDTGVFRSLNNGNTWEPINGGLPILNVLRLEIDPNVPGGLFASTDGAGIWSWEP